MSKRSVFNYYWRGQPISEIPREELERLFIMARQEIEDINGQLLNKSIEHVRDLAKAARRR